MAYYFDRAVTVFGLEVEGEMDKAAAACKTSEEMTRKRRAVLSLYLSDIGAPPSPAKGMYKDPMGNKAIRG